MYTNLGLCASQSLLDTPMPHSGHRSFTPVSNENRLDGGSKSLLELQLISTSQWHTDHSLFLGLGSSTGFISPWFEAQNPLPAYFPEELETGLSTCSESTSISITSPENKITSTDSCCQDPNNSLNPLDTMSVQLLT